MYSVGQTVHFLLKVHKERFTVEAKVTHVAEKAVTILFRQPPTRQASGGYEVVKTILKADWQERLLAQPVPREPLPANADALKLHREEKRKVTVSIDLSGARLAAVARYLDLHVEDIPSHHDLKRLVYQAVDQLVGYTE